ncbi:TPA: hypothetical protein QEL30_004185 [Stenotrophomonas maltophilia]|nr:hypothetical protein [Stenotrophomonas maltophilia]HDS1599300.1 hypothetical protein [Stenotrophomonas maltophilia]
MPAARKRAMAKEVVGPAPPQAADWKNHPVLIVGGAVVATAITCLTYFNQFALPQRTATLENKASQAIEEANRLTDALGIEHGLNKKLQKDVADLQKREKELSGLLSESRTVNMFQAGSAYPNGFSLVKVGMTEADVFKSYPIGSITPSGRGYLSVKFANSPFSSATYYIDENTESRVITHILFMLKFGQGELGLVRRMSENLGKPFVIPPDYYAWPASGNVNVFMGDDTSYIVMRPGSRPASWPTEKENEIVCKAAAQAKGVCPINQ